MLEPGSLDGEGRARLRASLGSNWGLGLNAGERPGWNIDSFSTTPLSARNSTPVLWFG